MRGKLLIWWAYSWTKLRNLTTTTEMQIENIPDWETAYNWVEIMHCLFRHKGGETRCACFNNKISVSMLFVTKLIICFDEHASLSLQKSFHVMLRLLTRCSKLPPKLFISMHESVYLMAACERNLFLLNVYFHLYAVHSNNFKSHSKFCPIFFFKKSQPNRL